MPVSLSEITTAISWAEIAVREYSQNPTSEKTQGAMLNLRFGLEALNSKKTIEAECARLRQENQSLREQLHEKPQQGGAE